jgi:hypothetical protein
MKKLVRESLEKYSRAEMMAIQNELEELWQSEQSHPDWIGKTFNDFANDSAVLKAVRADGAAHGWKEDDQGNYQRRTLMDDEDENMKYF